MSKSILNILGETKEKKGHEKEPQLCTGPLPSVLHTRNGGIFFVRIVLKPTGFSTHFPLAASSSCLTILGKVEATGCLMPNSLVITKAHTPHMAFTFSHCCFSSQISWFHRHTHNAYNTDTNATHQHASRSWECTEHHQVQVECLTSTQTLLHHVRSHSETSLPWLRHVMAGQGVLRCRETL